MSDLECTVCGQPASVHTVTTPIAAEPEAAKVIVVERDGHPARFFAAVSWEVLTSGTEAGDLTLTADSGECVAQFGARMWDSACDAEAILPADLYARQGKKLAIALDALREFAASETVDGRAATALYEIAELDL
jgi:hypothetical protein